MMIAIVILMLFSGGYEIFLLKRKKMKRAIWAYILLWLPPFAMAAVGTAGLPVPTITDLFLH
jgi:hypothetical protein